MGIKTEAPIQNPTSQDVFDFLNSLEGGRGNGQNMGAAANPSSSIPAESPDDIFSSFNK